MQHFGELYQTADWKKEKHVPVIEGPDEVKAGELLKMTATVGKEIPHPNTTEHHIAWIKVYFHGEGEQFPYEIGTFEFSAHGATTRGPNTGPVYTHPEVTFTFTTDKPGTVYSTSYCNIHGLWLDSKEIKVK